jgi:Protein of unknown function (DUF992)
MRWRWIVLVLPTCAAFNVVPGLNLAMDVGVLSCTLGPSIHVQVSDRASEAVGDMLCSFSPAKNGPDETYVGTLKNTKAVGPLPENVSILWTVRAPFRKRLLPGFLQQTYSVDPKIPPGEAAPLVGEKTARSRCTRCWTACREAHPIQSLCSSSRLSS